MMRSKIVKMIPMPVMLPIVLFVLWAGVLTIGILFHVYDPSKSPSTLSTAWFIWTAFIGLTYLLVRCIPVDYCDGYVVFVAKRIQVDYKTLERTYIVGEENRENTTETSQDLSKPWPQEFLPLRFFLEFAWAPLCLCLEFALVVNLAIVTSDDVELVKLGLSLFNVLFGGLVFLLYGIAYNNYYAARYNGKDYQERKSAAVAAYKMRTIQSLRRELGLEKEFPPV